MIPLSSICRRSTSIKKLPFGERSTYVTTDTVASGRAEKREKRIPGIESPSLIS